MEKIHIEEGKVRRMNNILLIGNGFDLAHGLKTRYDDFLYLIKNWDEFSGKYRQERKSKKKRALVQQSLFYFMGEEYEMFSDGVERYLEYASDSDEREINRIGEIIKTNSWVNYYRQCDAEIDGWIDFEREIYPVIELFDRIMNADYEMLGSGGSLGSAHIDRSDLTPQQLRIARLWGKYIDTSGHTIVSVKEPYASMRYGILKKKIMQSLRDEFDEFVEAFEIYLQEFVQRKRNVHPLRQIKEIGIDYVISFNYTLTERIYGVNEENVHHIHGMVREGVLSRKNGMVMGVNEQNGQNIDFIYFVKYFQRIQKKSGVKYKTFVEREDEKERERGWSCLEEYLLHIYGHSLDETDADILKYVIGDVNQKGELNLKPNQVIIYYYNSSDYEQKVINLIKLYGRSIVEEYMENDKFKFVETSPEKWMFDKETE